MATTMKAAVVREFGTRLDLQEALDFARDQKVKATVETDTLDNINDVFARMHKGDIQGRVVLDFGKSSEAVFDYHASTSASGRREIR